MSATVTTSQQRRFLALRNGGGEGDTIASIGPVLAALRGLTTVAAEGAAKQAATESASNPPLEVKARVTGDGRTLFDLKNVSTDGDPQELAQAAFNRPNERFAAKFMNLRRDAAPPAAPTPQPSSMSEMAGAAASDLGLPSPVKSVVEGELKTLGGQYRAQRDSGAGPIKALLKATLVRSLPAVAEDAIRARQADAQVERRILRLGRAYGAVAPIVSMYRTDRASFVDWVKHLDSMDGKQRDDLMSANAELAKSGAPDGVDPEEYVAKLAGLDVLPEAFRPLVRATIAERSRKLAKEAEQAGLATKRDERADASAERAVAAAERATNAEARSQERFNVAMQKVAEATKEKPYKFAIGDAEVLQPDYLISRIGDESSDQPSLERTLQRQLSKNSTQFNTLTAERKALSSKYNELQKQLVEAQARMDKNEYGPGAASRVAKLTDDISAIRKRGEQIDELRKPLSTSIATIQQGVERFSVTKDEWDALLATGETAASLKKQGIRMKK